MFDDLIAGLVAANPKTYHFHAPLKESAPYIVWAEDERMDLITGEGHSEDGWQGTIDLFTKTEGDSLCGSIESVLEDTCIYWDLNSIQYEAETGLIHYEWVWNYA